jgi:hypothetical protein
MLSLVLCNLSLVHSPSVPIVARGALPKYGPLLHSRLEDESLSVNRVSAAGTEYDGPAYNGLRRDVVRYELNVAHIVTIANTVLCRRGVD